MYRPACRIIHTGGRSTCSPRTALRSKGSCDVCMTLHLLDGVECGTYALQGVTRMVHVATSRDTARPE